MAGSGTGRCSLGQLPMRTKRLARRTCRAEAVRLARRIKTLTTDLATNRAGIADLIADTAPELLAPPGVGAVVAAAVMIAWSHPGRVRSEAAMVSRAGTCPIPDSSGNGGSENTSTGEVTDG